ncbi:MAG: hypothetical protein N2170_10010, partial [Bacteroidia bacterium]|nr:hypothetical protein [Bacteroidia bacterium]
MKSGTEIPSLISLLLSPYQPSMGGASEGPSTSAKSSTRHKLFLGSCFFLLAACNPYYSARIREWRPSDIELPKDIKKVALVNRSTIPEAERKRIMEEYKKRGVAQGAVYGALTGGISGAAYGATSGALTGISVSYT